MTSHYPDLGSASDCLNQISQASRPIRSTSHIWGVTRHQYGISALVSQTSFGGETSGGVAKFRLFSQAIFSERQKLAISDSSFSDKPFLTLCFSFVVALDPPSSWSLTAQASGKSLILDWSSFPNDLNTEYFIVFLNQTEIHENNDHRYDHENYNPIRMLRFFNLSETEVNVSDIPAATEFQAVAYLVAENNDIYKSQTLTIKSAEGGKKLKFFFLYTLARYSKPSGLSVNNCGCWK